MIDEKNTNLYGMVGISSKMQEVYNLIRISSDHKVTVLLEGETGTGKELVAKAIHYHSDRRNKQFLPVNATAIPHDLAESEFFGHEKGAFTSAVSNRIGKFEAASDGTLFLDEIGDMDGSLQAKLLRVLENKTFERVGGNNTINFQARIIAATNKSLWERVKEGNFRDDLYYRLCEFPVTLPPLRDRKEDIPSLAAHFLALAREEFKKDVKKVTVPAMNMLMEYDWPGNVRELKNVINKGVLLSKQDEITPDQLAFFNAKEVQSYLTFPFDISLSEIEKRTIKEILLLHNGNKRKVAKLLGIGEATLYRKMKEYNLFAFSQSSTSTDCYGTKN